MNILVCISHVPDTISRISFTDQETSFDTQGVQFVINPNDEFALTRAIHFKEKSGAKITVLNVGKSNSDPSLRKALAIGADKAIRINTAPKNGMFVAKQIAYFVRQESYDLIIAGRESIDYNGSVVPGALAGLLDYGFINHCVGLEIEDNIATAQREVKSGKETLSIKLPLVVAAQKGLVEERDLKIPNMRGIMMARQKPLKVLESIDVKPQSVEVKFEKPKSKEPIRMISTDDLVDILHNELKVI